MSEMRAARERVLQRQNLSSKTHFEQRPPIGCTPTLGNVHLYLLIIDLFYYLLITFIVALLITGVFAFSFSIYFSTDTIEEVALTDILITILLLLIIVIIMFLIRTVVHQAVMI